MTAHPSAILDALLAHVAWTSMLALVCTGLAMRIAARMVEAAHLAAASQAAQANEAARVAARATKRAAPPAIEPRRPRAVYLWYLLPVACALVGLTGVKTLQVFITSPVTPAAQVSR